MHNYFPYSSLINLRLSMANVASSQTFFGDWYVAEDKPSAAMAAAASEISELYY